MCVYRLLYFKLKKKDNVLTWKKNLVWTFILSENLNYLKRESTIFLVSKINNVVFIEKNTKKYWNSN